jgi:hypothetical protein
LLLTARVRPSFEEGGAQIGKRSLIAAVFAQDWVGWLRTRDIRMYRRYFIGLSQFSRADNGRAAGTPIVTI